VRFEGWAPFGGWQFVLPRLLIVFEGHEAKATVIASEAELAGAGLESLAVDALAGGTREVFDIAAGETTGTDFEHWAGSIDAAIDAIRAGAYQKVVLAVQRSVEMASNIDQGALLASLASRYPDCYTFKFVAGGAAWLGASPELLVGNERGAVSAASLAGSRPRGRTAEDDDALAEELMTSPKERVEHRLVVEALVGSLATVCDGVEASTEPQVMRMANIQHLHTPVCGTVRPGSDILDLVAAVHPTPAVGGSPRRAAVAAIEALEDIDRGWYAAPIGWLDLEGNGEFAVALRSGLVRGNRADLFAGCGIVDGSVPQAEIAEVEQKLRALGDTIEALQA
jgi:isochorismate synthase